MKHGIRLLFLFALAGIFACNQVDQVAPGGSKLSIFAQPDTVATNGISTITVTGTRANGAPLPDGTVIHFSVNQAGTISPNPVETQGGTATTTFHAANISGDIIVSATSGDAPPATVTIHVGEARASHVFVSANPSVLPPTGGTSKITAIVTDTNGNALSGIGVQFTTDQGTLASGGKSFTQTPTAL